jgi:hypothetical protein
MFDLWKTELTEEETEKLIEDAAHEIERRKLEVPAVLMLESHKPLAFVGSQTAIMFAPFIAPILGFDFLNNYSRLFSKRENIERLLQRIESGRAKALAAEKS